MWIIGVEVEQETSAPLLKKILDPPLEIVLLLTDDTALKENQSPQPEINRPIAGHIHNDPLLSSWLANQKRER